MKTFNIFVFHGKIRVLGGSVHEYSGGLAWTVCRFEGLGKKGGGGGVFERGD